MDREPYEARISPFKNVVEVFNADGKLIESVSANGYIRKAELVLGRDGKKKVIVAVDLDRASSNKDAGKLILLYEGRNWPFGNTGLKERVIFDANHYGTQSPSSEVELRITDFDISDRRPDGSFEVAALVSGKNDWDVSYLILLDDTGKLLYKSDEHSGRLEVVHIARTRPTPMGIANVIPEPSGPVDTIYVAGWGIDDTDSSNAGQQTLMVRTVISIPPGGDVAHSYYSLTMYEKRQNQVITRWQLLVYPKGEPIYDLQFYPPDNQTLERITFWHRYGYQYNIIPEVSRVFIEYLGEKPEALYSRDNVCYELLGAHWGNSSDLKWYDQEE
jgi:hypothetical protein